MEIAPQLGGVGPWIAASFYVVLLGITMGVRFHCGAWKKLRLIEDAPPTPGASDPDA